MKEWKLISALFLSAIIFRILHYLAFSGEIVAGLDQIANITLGRKFASGDFYGVLDTYWTPVYPFLIGIVTFFINDIILPALMISIVAGSLAIPVTYFLVRQSYGKREAVIAAVIAVFYPHLVNSSVFTIGTENVYLLWIIGALIIGSKALEKDSARDFLLTGILVGLAYLTRPEAFGYVFFFAPLIFIKHLANKRAFSRRFFMQLGAFFLGFALLAAPYLFYLRSETGSWKISAKVDKNFADGKYSDEFLQKLDEEEAAAAKSLKQKGKDVAKIVVANTMEIHKNFPYLVPIFLLMLAALGLFGRHWEKRRLYREIYLILFCILTILGYAASVIQTRYLFILLPIFFGWIACGILQLERWLNASLRSWSPNKFHYPVNSKSFFILCLLLIYFYVLPLNLFMLSRDAPVEERDAGLWLKENGKKAPLIMSDSVRPVFYAEGKRLPLATAEINEISAQMKEKQIDYLVVSERSIKRKQFLEGLTETLQNSPEFELIYQKNEQSDSKISIFKLK
jgi:hypothetical protein